MNLLAQIASDTSPAGLNRWAFYALGIAAACGLTWLVKSRRNQAALERLNAEKCRLAADLVSLAGETVREIHRSRESYSAACQRCRRSAQKISALMVQGANIDEILAAREEFFQVLAKDAMSAFASYVEWHALLLKNEREDLQKFMEIDVRREIERFANWLGVLNGPFFIQGVRAAPLQIEKRSLRPFLELTRHFEAGGDAIVRTVLDPVLRRAQ